MSELLQAEAAYEIPKSGFTDWKVIAKQLGQKSLLSVVEKMDSESTGRGNAHGEIAERLGRMGLPVQKFVSPSVEDFVGNPGAYLNDLPSGDYYFVSIKPGTHLTHAVDESDIVLFAKSFLYENPNDSDTEMYISHNGEPVLSGHILVRNDGEPNTIHAEFTNGEFNAFHRGRHTPEVSVHRSNYRFEWKFNGALASDDDWRTSEQFTCNGGIELNRTEIAKRLFNAINLIPKDGNIYLPGYYEVLLERTELGKTRTVFIEANGHSDI